VSRRATGVIRQAGKLDGHLTIRARPIGRHTERGGYHVGARQDMPIVDHDAAASDMTGRVTHPYRPILHPIAPDSALSLHSPPRRRHPVRYRTMIDDRQ
jgi:hypothetical protein